MIEHQFDEEVHLLSLNRGKANALNAEFLGAIADVVEECTKSPGRGLVLTSEGSIFCAGLDLPELIELDRDGIVELVEALDRAVTRLFEHPRPTVASINGHAIAGGALLTVACDLRHMQMGNAKWGLNEAQLGLAMPPFTVELLRYAFSRKAVEKLLYGGGLYPPFKAHDMGILDELVEEGDLGARAREAIVERTPSLQAFADIKARLHAPTLGAMAESRKMSTGWVDLWFSDDVQQRLRRVVEGLKTPPAR